MFTGSVFREKIGGLSVTEPGGGSDFAGQAASAEKIDSGWVPTEGMLYYYAGIADINVIICKT